jgi:hypothetical protein
MPAVRWQKPSANREIACGGWPTSCRASSSSWGPGSTSSPSWPRVLRVGTLEVLDARVGRWRHGAAPGCSRANPGLPRPRANVTPPRCRGSGEAVGKPANRIAAEDIDAGTVRPACWITDRRPPGPEDLTGTRTTPPRDRARARSRRRLRTRREIRPVAVRQGRAERTRKGVRLEPCPDQPTRAWTGRGRTRSCVIEAVARVEARNPVVQRASRVPLVIGDRTAGVLNRPTTRDRRSPFVPTRSRRRRAGAGRRGGRRTRRAAAGALPPEEGRGRAPASGTLEIQVDDRVT